MSGIPLLLMGAGDGNFMRAEQGTPGTYLDSEYIDSQTLINMYYKPGVTKDSGILIATPGSTAPKTAAGAGVVRGMIYDSTTDKLFVVSGNDITRWTNGTETDDIGDLSTSTGRVRFANNPRTDEILIVDGTAGYILNPSSNTLTAIADAQYPDTADVCAIIDGYFLVAISGDTTNPGQFYWSTLNDGTSWVATDIATKEGGQDPLVDIVVANREIYLLGETTSEIWFNSGDLDQIFEKHQGSFMEMGVAAPHMAAIADNKVLFPGRSSRGTGQVVALSGTQMEIISNQYISSRIQQLNWNIGSSIYGFGYSFYEDGHEFYAMSNTATAAASDATFVYDLTTKLWHRRAHFHGTTFPSGEIWTAFTMDGGGLHSLAFAVPCHGHRATGVLYLSGSPSGSLSSVPNAGTGNNTDVVTRRVIGPMIRSDKRIRFSEVTLEMGGSTGAGEFTPGDISLYVSKDGGATWGSAITMNRDDLGYNPDGGVYRAHNLGTGKNWRFRLDISSTTQSFAIKGLWGRPYGNTEPRVTYG